MRRKVILQAETECRRPLAGHAEGFFFLESADAVVDVIDIANAANGQFQHGSYRGIEAEMRFTVPLPTQTERNAMIV